MNFKQLFSKKKNEKTRQNLIVSIDDRLTGDIEVMRIKSTSTNNVVIQFNGQINEMSVHVDDLQDALNRIKDFMEARSPQPQTMKPLSLNEIDGINKANQKFEEQTKEQLSKIKQIPELDSKENKEILLKSAEFVEKELDLSN